MSVTMKTFVDTQVGEDTRKTAAIDQSGSGLVTLSETIAALAADVQHALVIDVSAIKALRILATGAMTIETNSTSSPGQTIVLVADRPYVWNNGDLSACPLTVDVTTIYVSSTPGGQLDIECLYDATP